MSLKLEQLAFFILVFSSILSKTLWAQSIEQNQMTSETSTILKKDLNKKKKMFKSEIKNHIDSSCLLQLLVGGNFSVYEQRQSDLYVKYSSLNYLDWHLKFRQNIDPNWVWQFLSWQSLGQIGVKQTKVDGEKKYIWKVVELGAVYHSLLPTELMGYKFRFTGQMGLQYHQMPLLTSKNNQKFAWTNESLTAVTLGGGLDFILNKLSNIEWLVNYQIPISISAKLPKKQKYIFDGSLIWNYKISSQFTSNLAWYGQWANFGVDQTLFQSTIGIGGGYWF